MVIGVTHKDFGSQVAPPVHLVFHTQVNGSLFLQENPTGAHEVTRPCFALENERRTDQVNVKFRDYGWMLATVLQTKSFRNLTM